jgi:hypothetical protein
MDMQDLRRKIKPSTSVYMSWFLFGSHYAHMGKWGTQILFWLTLGGLGIWAVNDLINMNEIITRHRESVFRQIEAIEKLDKTPVQRTIKRVPKVRLAIAGY